jgi:hypothetical protein
MTYSLFFFFVKLMLLFTPDYKLQTQNSFKKKVIAYCYPDFEKFKAGSSMVYCRFRLKNASDRMPEYGFKVRRFGFHLNNICCKHYHVQSNLNNVQTENRAVRMKF